MAAERAKATALAAHASAHLPAPNLNPPPGGAVKRNAELFFPAEFSDDFPVSLQISERFGLVYVVTKLGLLFVYDLETATAVYRNRISPDPIFLAAPSDSTGGIFAVNRCGRRGGAEGGSGSKWQTAGVVPCAWCCVCAYWQLAMGSWL